MEEVREVFALQGEILPINGNCCIELTIQRHLGMNWRHLTIL
jgi:hypothetical protein